VYEPQGAEDVDREYVVFGEAENVAGHVDVNPCDRHAWLVRQWLSNQLAGSLEINSYRICERFSPS